MRHLTDRLATSVLVPVAAAVAITTAIPLADGAERTWIDFGLGMDRFDEPLNWSPNIVPGFFDTAIFDDDGGMVIVDASHSLQGLQVTDGTVVTLDVTSAGSLSLDGGFFYAGGWYGLDLYENGDLTVIGDVSTDGVKIGVGGGFTPTPAVLRIDDGATLTVDFPHAIVDDTARLHMIDGTFECESLTFEPDGILQFDGGLITVDGGTFEGPSVLSILGVNQLDPARLVLDNGATGSSSNNVAIGTPLLRGGELTLRNGSSFDGEAKLLVGSVGKGTFYVESNATATFSGSVRVDGPLGDPSAIFVVEATSAADTDRSRLIVGDGTNPVPATLDVGTDDFGLLFIQLGGLVEAEGDVQVATQIGGEGLLSVAGEMNGAPAELRANDDLLVGTDAAGANRGDGSVELYDGGLLDVADVTLIGPDDTMTISGGTLRTGSLRVLNPSVFAFPFTNGLVEVDGGLVLFESGVISADGFPPHEDPLFRMQNGASASVTSVAAGTAGEGRIELTSGSTLSAANGNVGLSAGAEGRFTFTGDGTFASITTLGIGAGGTGFVTVDDRAEVISGSVTLGAAGGDAFLTLSNGGRITSTSDVRIAADTTGGDAGITVSGTSGVFQSRLDTNGDLLIGADATGAGGGFGAMTVGGGAAASVAGTTVIGPNDQLNVAGGFLTTTNLTSYNVGGGLGPSNGIGFGDGTISVDGGTLDLASGALSINAPSLTSGNMPHPTWVLSNGASTTLTDLNVGVIAGPATMFVAADSSLYAANGTILSGDLEVTGANAYAGFGALDVAEFGTANVLVSAGGELFPNGLTIGKQTGNGTVTVGGFSTLYVEGDADVGGFAGAATGTGTLEVLIGGNATVVDRLTIHPNGRLELDDTASVATTELVPGGTIELTLTEDDAPSSGPLITSFGGGSSVALGGTFAAVLDAGVVPGAGARWTVLSAPEITGTFDAVALPPLANAQFALVETTGGLGEILELRVEASTPGDVDLDGMVTFSDLSTLLANWGPCPASGACPADFDGDGSTAFADLVILLANWG